MEMAGGPRVGTCIVSIEVEVRVCRQGWKRGRRRGLRRKKSSRQ